MTEAGTLRVRLAFSNIASALNYLPCYQSTNREVCTLLFTMLLKELSDSVISDSLGEPFGEW